MDDISAAFENISVEDFLRESSAKTVTHLDPDEHAAAVGIDNFNHFTNAHIQSCVDALNESEFTAFSVLHNAKEERYFQPDDDETAYHFATRLKREAATMCATWVFIALVTPGRTYDQEDEDLIEPIDPDNRKQVNDLIESGVLQVSVCWYSDYNENGERHRRSGMINLDNPAEQVEGDIDAEHNPFHDVLGA
jgi:hypothetical protein